MLEFFSFCEMLKYGDRLQIFVLSALEVAVCAVVHILQLSSSEIGPACKLVNKFSSKISFSCVRSRI